jgi:hypothetical protein
LNLDLQSLYGCSTSKTGACVYESVYFAIREWDLILNLKKLAMIVLSGKALNARFEFYEPCLPHRLRACKKRRNDALTRISSKTQGRCAVALMALERLPKRKSKL